MLEHLEVRGLGIIDRVEMEFDGGFVALTGETGAGKSLLVESLKLLSGQRAQADLVRTGDDRLRVEGRFLVETGDQLNELLDELGFDGTEEIILRREVQSGGRSRAWLNDTPVAASTLQRLAPFLLAIHGQHEQFGLADTNRQRALIDQYARHDQLVKTTRTAFEAWESAHQEVARMVAARTQRRDRLDVIAFQMAEIDALDPQQGEDEELRQQRQIARNQARLIELTQTMLRALAEGESPALDQVVRAERAGQEINEYGIDLGSTNDCLEQARVALEDVVRTTQDLAARFEGEPDELEGIESRLHRLEQLMLKYGDPLTRVIEHRQSLDREKAGLESLEDDLDQARVNLDACLRHYLSAALALHESRQRAGRKLAESVCTVLEKLAMKGVRLEIQWLAVTDSDSPLEHEGQHLAFSADGIYECEFQFAANPGEEPRPMARVASGGELSRLHLALCTALREVSDSTPRCLLFDEVDSGLGGATASALAGVLRDLADHDQVVTVTHLPQVAARAKGHFRIEKVEKQGRAVTQVHPLTTEQREIEIARMVAGAEIGDSALEHAQSLLQEQS